MSKKITLCTLLASFMPIVTTHAAEAYNAEYYEPTHVSTRQLVKERLLATSEDQELRRKKSGIALTGAAWHYHLSAGGRKDDVESVVYLHKQMSYARDAAFLDACRKLIEHKPELEGHDKLLVVSEDDLEGGLPALSRMTKPSDEELANLSVALWLTSAEGKLHMLPRVSTAHVQGVAYKNIQEYNIITNLSQILSNDSDMESLQPFLSIPFVEEEREPDLDEDPSFE